MSNIKVDFSKNAGAMRDMHSVNNGPFEARGGGNEKMFSDIGVPFARTHDSSFYAGYGGAHTVDVHRIFPDFDKDENVAENYDFTLTDKYIGEIIACGTKVFYRLGASIEHEIKKYGTYPPKDYLKWAKICEHIIRHYNEKWADGFEYGIEYWEIWNEPDCRNANGSNPCWQGTDEEFYEFFTVAFKHLKKCFPLLKIGGPAMCGPCDAMWDELLPYLKEYDAYLDFYSFHGYFPEPHCFTDGVLKFEEMLKNYGMPRGELILNEWNYVRDWVTAIRYSYKTLITYKAASFCLACMLDMQTRTKLDHFMYYDARPTLWNGLIDNRSMEYYPPFYAFKIFGDMYRLKNQAVSETDEKDIFACAAQDGDNKAIALTYYNDSDDLDERRVSLDISGLDKPMRADIYLSDETCFIEPVRTEYISTARAVLYFNVKKYDQIYIKLAPSEM